MITRHKIDNELILLFGVSSNISLSRAFEPNNVKNGWWEVVKYGNTAQDREILFKALTLNEIKAWCDGCLFIKQNTSIINKQIN